MLRNTIFALALALPCAASAAQRTISFQTRGGAEKDRKGAELELKKVRGVVDASWRDAHGQAQFMVVYDDAVTTPQALTEAVRKHGLYPSR